MFLLPAWLCVADDTLSLAESVALVRARSETILSALEDVQQAEDTVSSASTGAHPHLYLKGDFTRRQESGGGGGGFSGFGDPQEQNYYLALEQPLYHGLRDRLTIKNAKALLAAREADAAAQRVALTHETVLRFFAVLDVQVRQEANATAVTLQRKRLDVLRQRREAGDLRRSDLLQANTVLQELLVARERLVEEERLARAELAFLVGDRAAEPLTPPPSLTEPLPGLPKQEAYAFENRQELRSLARQLDASGYAATRIARESHPDVDLTADLYGYREGFPEDSSWEVGITLSWELTGGRDRRAREAKEESKGRQLSLAISDAKKQISRSLVTTRAAIEQSTVIQGQQRQQLATTKELHDIISEEYAAGEATALEVDAAFTDWRQAEQNLAREQLREQRLRYRLRLLTGEDPWPDTQ